MRNKKIKHDIDVAKDPLPSRELLQGKVHKQYGTMTTPDGSCDYFIERHRDSECEIELEDLDLNVVKVKAAIFEVWIKDPDTGEWICGNVGPAPIDLELYDAAMESIILF